MTKVTAPDPVYPAGTRVRVARPESANDLYRGKVGVVRKVNDGPMSRPHLTRVALHVVAFPGEPPWPGPLPVQRVAYYPGACLDPLPE